MLISIGVFSGYYNRTDQGSQQDDRDDLEGEKVISHQLTTDGLNRAVFEISQYRVIEEASEYVHHLSNKGNPDDECGPSSSVIFQHPFLVLKVQEHNHKQK